MPLAMIGAGRRIRAGIGANGFSQLANIGIQLAAVPLFLHFWGANGYGVWVLLLAVVDYLRLIPLGFPEAAANDMTMRVGREDRAGAIVTFQSVLALYLMLWGLLLPMAALLTFLPLGTWLNLEQLTDQGLTTLLGVLALSVFSASLMGVLRTGFHCAGQFARGTMASTFVLLFETSAVVVVVARGGDIFTAAMALGVARVIGTLAFALYLRRHVPWLPIGVGDWDWHRTRELFVPALGFVSAPLTMALRIQGVVVAIGIVLGPTVVAAFTVLRTLSRVLVQAVTVVNSAVIPELSRYFGAGDADSLRVLHHRVFSFALWASLFGGLFFALVGEWFFAIWTGGGVVFDPVLFHWLLLAAALDGLWNTSSTYHWATNSFHLIALVLLFGAVSLLVFVYALLPEFGVRAVAVGTVIMDGFILVFIVRRSLRKLDETWPGFLGSVLRPWRLWSRPT